MAENKRDTIPEHFARIEEAAEFWDTHDLADYADMTKEVTATVDLQRRRLKSVQEADHDNHRY